MFAFSILYRIEWVETSSVIPPRYLIFLSVSCIGSNGLKHEDATGDSSYLVAFSILYRIEWVETVLLISLHEQAESFSILYRIEWVETSSSWPMPL